MDSVNLASTDMKISKLGFGTASLHHTIKESKRLALLSSIYNLGFNYFDTARIYGDGIAERTLGKFLSDGKREHVVLSSKFGLVANPLYEKFPFLMYGEKIIRTLLRKVNVNLKVRELERKLSISDVALSLSKSLEALQTSWLDIFFLHEAQVEDVEYILKLIPWLREQKRDGTIRYIGLSGNSVNCLEVYSKIPDLFDVLQIEDSIENSEADILTLEKVPLHVTFGYIRNSTSNDKEAVFKEALKRNKEKVILVSSNNINNLSQLVDLTKR